VFLNVDHCFRYATDSPINIRSVFYVGKQHTEKFGMKKMESGVSLFSRRVLIQSKVRFSCDVVFLCFT
jgi:HSP90 family molecular chaperone